MDSVILGFIGGLFGSFIGLIGVHMTLKSNERLKNAELANDVSLKQAELASDDTLKKLEVASHEKLKTSELIGAFRHEQLHKFYGPIHARLLRMESLSQVVKDVRANKEALVDDYKLKGLERIEQIRAAQDLHSNALVKIKVEWNEICAFMIENWHLAEPETESFFKELSHYCERMNAIRLDAGGAIGLSETGEDNFDHSAFEKHIKSQYDSFSLEMRTATYLPSKDLKQIEQSKDVKQIGQS